jgi:hypothetical protein
MPADLSQAVCALDVPNLVAAAHALPVPADSVWNGWSSQA